MAARTGEFLYLSCLWVSLLGFGGVLPAHALSYTGFPSTAPWPQQLWEEAWSLLC